MNKTVLAFDIGASSGRAILGKIVNGDLQIREVHRFENIPIYSDGHLYWDIHKLYSDIKIGIKKAVYFAGNDRIQSLGIDTWGVDFGFINSDGELSDNPLHYRDKRTSGVQEEAEKIIPKTELYEKTGIQFMFSNTLYQLIGMQRKQPEITTEGKKLLMIPDILINMLTGSVACEETIASTTQIYNPMLRNWDESIAEKISISKDIFPEILQPGSFRGYIKDEICRELDIYPIALCTVAEHDTASAVVSRPCISGTENEDHACVSCGTVSILGAETDAPYLSGKAFEYNFTNEVGYDSKIRLMKNIAGMWLINESRRWWEKEIRLFTFEELTSMAANSEPFRYMIDPDGDNYIHPGNIPERIQEYCVNTGQGKPKAIGDIVRTIYESIAAKHALYLRKLSEITNTEYKAINLLGGGSKNVMFCKMLSSACGLPVIAGPSEATAIGNCLVQLIALGEIEDLTVARKIVGKMSEIKRYEPENLDQWQDYIEKYRNFMKWR